LWIRTQLNFNYRVDSWTKVHKIPMYFLLFSKTIVNHSLLFRLYLTKSLVFLTYLILLLDIYFLKTLWFPFFPSIANWLNAAMMTETFSLSDWTRKLFARSSYERNKENKWIIQIIRHTFFDTNLTARLPSPQFYCIEDRLMWSLWDQSFLLRLHETDYYNI